MQKSFAEKWHALDPGPTNVQVLPTIDDAFHYVRSLDSDIVSEKDGDKNCKKEVHAFVTGSLHLVGRALSVLEGVDAL